MAARETITCCPHCGSEEGFITKSDYLGVPYKVNFKGEPLNNYEMYDQTDYIRNHRDVACIACGKKICTLRKMYSMIEASKN